MENPEHLQSSEQMPIPEDFQNANAIIQSISQPKDSQPTKLRVKNFKNRVFHLIKIFTTNSTNVNPLVESLKQEMFLSEPEKMRELVNQVLNKQNIDLGNLQQLLQYHKVILLYKNDKVKGDAVATDFIKILKKISHADANIAQETVLELLKSFAFVRKSKLNINFFFYFFRNFEGGAEIKKLLLEKCEEYINDPKLRNAQKKQLTKLKNKLDKTSRPKPVKKQEEQSQDDEIMVIGKKKNTSKALKVQKKEQKHENNQIEEQGEVQKPKKEISTQQKEKLQRIKDNKKKNRKQNKSKPRNEQQNGHSNGQQRKPNHQNNNQKPHQNQKPHHEKNQSQSQKPHQEKNQTQNPSTPSKQKKHFSKQKGKTNKFQKKNE